MHSMRPRQRMPRKMGFRRGVDPHGLLASMRPRQRCRGDSAIKSPITNNTSFNEAAAAMSRRCAVATKWRIRKCSSMRPRQRCRGWLIFLGILDVLKIARFNGAAA